MDKEFVISRIASSPTTAKQQDARNHAPQCHSSWPRKHVRMHDGKTTATSLCGFHRVTIRSRDPGHTGPSSPVITSPHHTSPFVLRRERTANGGRRHVDGAKCFPAACRRPQNRAPELYGVLREPSTSYTARKWAVRWQTNTVSSYALRTSRVLARMPHVFRPFGYAPLTP